MPTVRASWPLISFILIVALAAGALERGHSFGVWLGSMQIFMGLFFVFFSLFKFWDLPGFVEGFQLYDRVAQRFSLYGYAYPFLELFLGLGFLAGWRPRVIALGTLLLMGVSAVWVIGALAKGLEVRCACMGTVLNLPLSTVTLTEDLGMFGMALWLLIH